MLVRSRRAGRNGLGASITNNSTPETILDPRCLLSEEDIMYLYLSPYLRYLGTHSTHAGDKKDETSISADTHVTTQLVISSLNIKGGGTF